MYTGHAALALLAKAKRPKIALALLLPAAWAPDWIELVLAHMGHQNRMWSHSLVSVGIGSTLVALIYLAVTRRRTDAVAVWLTYVSHWPADYITGIKPTWPGGPMVGRMLYAHAAQDFLLESALVVAAAFAYSRTVPPSVRKRRAMPLIPLGLIALQVGFEYMNGSIGLT